MSKLSKKELREKSKFRKIFRIIFAPWLFLRALFLYAILVRQHGGPNIAGLRSLQLAIKKADRVVIFGASEAVLDFLDDIRPNDFVITLNSGMLLPVRKDLSFWEVLDKDEYGEMWEAEQHTLRSMFSAQDLDTPAPSYFAITNLRKGNTICDVSGTRLNQVFFYEYPWFPESPWAFKTVIKIFRALKLHRFGLAKVRYSLSRAILLAVLSGCRQLDLYGVDGINRRYFWQSANYSLGLKTTRMAQAWENIIQGRANEKHRTHDPKLGPMTVPKLLQTCRELYPDVRITMHLPKSTS